MFRYISYDIETAGLFDGKHPDKRQIIQIAAVVDELSLDKEPTPIDDLPMFCEFVRNEDLTFHPFAMNMHRKSGLMEAYFEALTGGNKVGYLGQVMYDFGKWLHKHAPISIEENEMPPTRKITGRWNFAGKNLWSLDLPFSRQSKVFDEQIYRYIRHKLVDPATSFIMRLRKPPPLVGGDE